MTPLRFVTIDPAHFHAALVQKEMYPQVDSRCSLYAPLGADALAHVQRLVGFNARSEQPTTWQLDFHGGPDFLERAFRDKAGQVVILAGRNAKKIDYIVAAVTAGLHVLADKPWILTPADLPKVQVALDAAERQGKIAFDIMTERFEITSLLQKELILDPAIFGTIEKGSLDEPAVAMESIHHIKKNVAGAPLRRSAAFFDVHQQGEALSDVGPHLVDLIPWILFPGQLIDRDRDIEILRAKRWPTTVSRSAFQQITGDADFPAGLQSQVQNGELQYFCNTQVQYALRGIHAKVDVLWSFEAEPGAGDTHLAVFRGSKARVEVRQGRDEKFRPEVYVVPNAAGDLSTIRAGLEKRMAEMQATHPGVGFEEVDGALRLTIPESLRTSHEAHFAEVTRLFLRYATGELPLPAWEKANMLAKYWVTTRGVEMSRAPK